ncbi:MAG TPA: DMT family transporter [Chloroflexia bacterium]|nr:DMT family transporter [Chloroflexia bacterium]
MKLDKLRLKPGSNWRPVLALTAVVASWASASVVTRYLYLHELASPFTLMVARFSLAGIISLLTYYFLYRKRNPDKLPLVGGSRVYLLGGLMMTAFILGFNAALFYITAILGSLYFYALNPVLMYVIGYFWLGTSFGWRQIAGLLLAMLGLVIVISGGDFQHLIASFSGSNLLFGLALMSLAGLGWSAYSLWGKRYTLPRPGTSILSNGINQLLGVFPILVLWLVIEPGGLFKLQPLSWLLILYVGVVPTSLGFAIFYTVLKELTVNQAATIQLLNPVFAAILAIIFLGEPFNLALVAGTLVLLYGIRVSTRLK